MPRPIPTSRFLNAKCGRAAGFAGVAICAGMLLALASLSRADDFIVDNDDLYVTGNVSIGTLTVMASIAGIDSDEGEFFFDTYYQLPWADDLSYVVVETPDTLFSSSWAPTAANLATSGNINLGPWLNGNTSWDGLSLRFADLENETAGNITFIAASPKGFWSWQQNAAVSAEEQMSLDDRGRLTVTEPSSGNVVSITPAAHAISLNAYGGALQTIQFSGTAGFTSALGYGGLSLDGTNPAQPFLRLGGGVLSGNNDNGSFDFNDTVFLNPSDQNIVFGNATYGDYVLSGNSTTFAAGSVLIGALQASGGVAIGRGGQALNGSTAIGIESVAIALGSVALAGGNTTGNHSLSIGAGSAATAAKALAVGKSASAGTWATGVMGHYNQAISGNDSAWQPSAPALIVGVGNESALANGLAVFNNGTASLGGARFAHPDYVSPTDVSQPQALQVNGATVFNGTAIFNGNATPTQSLPQGDVLMGPFAY